jgi:hypothetical protein
MVSTALGKLRLEGSSGTARQFRNLRGGATHGILQQDAGFHSPDYFLTLEGARVRKLRAAEVIQMSDSYELNPLFKRVIDEGR